MVNQTVLTKLHDIYCEEYTYVCRCVDKTYFLRPGHNCSYNKIKISICLSTHANIVTAIHTFIKGMKHKVSLQHTYIIMHVLFNMF